MASAVLSGRVSTIDQLIATIQKEFPSAGIRITGRARTLRRQAELMAERIRADRNEFIRTYLPRPHIHEMDQWYLTNMNASLDDTIDAFEIIITRAVRNGAVVSKHLSNSARDISWPVGNANTLNRIEARIRALGAHVIREPRAAGGRHWHVDW
ncbi:hypothetical protein [Nitrogeniibacter aestuarii]|uniref:hypothetical protein n=1 Tax=Nitrogeniibacter aestuarii TaxID=2815343 RepID=UPI001E455DEA|nr:hypothetical protein [Nitrogeniibacter aestuarii]